MRIARTLFPVMLIFSVLVAAPLTSSQTTSWKQIPVPTLPAFHPPEPRRIQLSNGMVIFLQEDHELPLIGGTARIRGGSSDEPRRQDGAWWGCSAKSGAPSGTKSQTGDQLDDYLRSPRRQS